MRTPLPTIPTAPTNVQRTPRSTLATAAHARLSKAARLARLAKVARGYTVVEVAMAMTLFAIGAAAVVAMERTAVQGDLDARKQDIATYITAMWIERLRRDALAWSLPDTTHPPPADNRSTTTYLNDAYFASAGFVCPTTGGDAGATVTAQTWMLPGTKAPVVTLSSSNVDGKSYLFDMFGRDLSTSDSGNAQFCTQIFLCWQDSQQKVIQASVRTIWPRGLNVAPASGWPCSTNNTGAPDDSAKGADWFRVVSETTLIEQTPH